MATRALSRISRCAAKVEATYNTDPATTLSTDGVLIAEGPNVVPNYNWLATPATVARTLTQQHKDVLSFVDLPVRLRGFLQGSGTLGSRTPASFAGQDAIFRACGMASTATPSTGPIAYTPAVISSGALESVWLDLENDGMLQEAGGCVGNITFSAQAQGRVTWDFTGMALYRAPSSGNLSSSFALTDRTEVFNGATGGIKPSDGSTYNAAGGLVLGGFEFNRGAVVQREISATATYGINSFFIESSRPTLSVTIAADTASANLDIFDIPPDITGRTDHGVEFNYGTTPNAVLWGFPTAQLLQYRKGTINGYDTITLEYLIRHSTKESEFSIKIGEAPLAIAT